MKSQPDTDVLVISVGPIGLLGAVVLQARTLGTDDQLGIAFEGSTNDRSFFVCDTDHTHGLTAEAVNLRLGDAEFLLSFPRGGGDDPAGQHRIIGLLPKGRDGELDEAARAAFGVSRGDSHGFSTYRVRHRMVFEFRRGCVMPTGDAADVHSPVGAKRMNTGLQDAHNLAVTLADAHPPPSLIRNPCSFKNGAAWRRSSAECRPVEHGFLTTGGARPGMPGGAPAGRSGAQGSIRRASVPGNHGYALSRSTMWVGRMHWCSTGSPRSRLSIICAIFAPIASDG